MDNIQSLCDRALLLHKGELLEDGPPASIIASYKRLLGQQRPADTCAKLTRV
jgi:ABC-type polysaccharide/polyol phosphate transport system ATPase subunit